MKNVIWFWNIVHWVFYKFDFKISMLISKYDPLNIIFKIPLIKNKFEKEGLNPNKVVEEAFKRPNGGISSMRAGGFVGGLTVLLIYGSLNYYLGFTKSTFNLEFYQLFFIIGLSLLLNYFVVFKEDKYLKYFKEYEKMQKKEKWKWALYSLATLVFIITFFIYSIYYEAHRPW